MTRATSLVRLNAPSTAMRYRTVMVDVFALVLSHGLLALAAWRLIQRGDLDVDPEAGDAPAPEPSVRDARPRAARQRP